MKCWHINFNNVEDCENDAGAMCMCCGSPICEEHQGDNCEFWWMWFIDI